MPNLMPLNGATLDGVVPPPTGATVRVFAATAFVGSLAIDLPASGAIARVVVPSPPTYAALGGVSFVDLADAIAAAVFPFTVRPVIAPPAPLVLVGKTVFVAPSSVATPAPETRGTQPMAPPSAPPRILSGSITVIAPAVLTTNIVGIIVSTVRTLVAFRRSQDVVAIIAPVPSMIVVAARPTVDLVAPRPFATVYAPLGPPGGQ
jgi:hypothetical protein